jgi:hypothetical protein
MSLFDFLFNKPEDVPEFGPFDLRFPLLRLSENDFWTIGDACEGTQVFGSTGSGKTSGSGRTMAKRFLETGFGGLVLTTKPDERALWEQYCKETGCLDYLMVVSPQEKYTFNFMDYELNRPGFGAGLTENLVNLFYNVLEIADRSKGNSSDPYWERTLKQLLRNTVDLITISTGRISLMEMYEVIISAPHDFEELGSKEWQESSFCFQLIKEGEDIDKSQSKKLDFEFTARYWLNEFPSLAEKTRSIIVSSFTSMADCFLRGVLRDMFCTTTNILPEFTHEGAIILLDLPVKEYGELGQYAQVLFKYVWQQSAERRDVRQNPRPVFLWVDEAQYFITSYDQKFQTTARSSRACTVYLSQNLPNYYAAMGGANARDKTDSFLGNLQTKIFHANGDSVTNAWAAELLAKTWQYRKSVNNSVSKDSSHFFPEVTGIQESHSLSESLEYQVLPHMFTTLRKGGFQNNLEVDAIIFQGGRIWRHTGKNYIVTSFSQT